MKKLSIFHASALILACLIFALYPESKIRAYDVNNEFIPGDFPEEVSSRIFSIPLEPGELMVVYPGSVESRVEEMKALLLDKCGVRLQFSSAEKLDERDFGGKHLIILGNIMNNKWALDLYKRRYAFADAYFPGKGGVIINPAKSLWDKERFVLVIGVSSNDDILPGFEAFLELLDDGASYIETIHYLKTSHRIPLPPESVESIFDRHRKDIHTSRVNYGLAPAWGFYYFLTGNKKWAEHFRNGMYFLHERGEKTGKWIPEPWTNMYFHFWRMAMVWDMLDEDPFFTMKDRRIIDEILWGYFNFCRGEPIPILDEDKCPPGEMRQNHLTFMALSLFQGHRYFTSKYGISGLDDAEEKFRRCFDGQALSYRPNDDAGGYLNYGVSHLLNYQMALGDKSYLESGKLKDAAALIAVSIDNRKDPVSFGDRGGYSHRREGAPRGYEDRFFSMAAWYYNDSQLQWINNWRTEDSVFSLEGLYSGEYIVNITAEYPERYLGIFPVFLDETSLRWCAKRTEKNPHLPLKNRLYIDKMSFRAGFDPEDEYLLIDGISFLAHGHYDGNSVSRLTWKDRIWLVDADYIKLTPQYHNGVVVVRDGVQEDPPPLTSLDFYIDYEGFGFSRTTSNDYNGADWERNIVWKKGEYFLFLDRITALEDGNFRLESRWRTLGDAKLSGNFFYTEQDGTQFFIKSADEAYRQIIEQDEVKVCLARKRMKMKTDSEWVFASLMYVSDKPDRKAITLFKSPDGIYTVKYESGMKEVFGINPSVLSGMGINTDCSLFLLDSNKLTLPCARNIKIGDSYLIADRSVNIELNFRSSSFSVVVPEGKVVECETGGFPAADISSAKRGDGQLMKLTPGTHTFKYAPGILNTDELLEILSASSKKILPEKPDVTMNFGIEEIKKFDIDGWITSVSSDSGALYCTADDRRVIRIEGETIEDLFTVQGSGVIRALCASDLNGDSKSEFLIGDDSENIFAYNASGNLLWKYKMSRYFGPNANANDITVGNIDDTGEKTILAATNGWKLYAFNSDGTVRWESFVYYHPLTKVRILKNPAKTYIVAGTVYSTPLNVVNPADGIVKWFTWEQVGDEFLSVTDYCGIHLTDMIFTDTDLDGEKEIVFGTKYHRIYALDADDGATRWKTNVGDEVNVLKQMNDPVSSEECIIVGNDAGCLIMLDRNGKKLKTVSFNSRITDIEIIAYSAPVKNEIIVLTVEGHVFICDDDFNIQSSFYLPDTHLKEIIPGEKAGDKRMFYCISNRSVHLLSRTPFFKSKSRFH